MAITDQIGSIINRGRDAVGAISAVADLPGLPTGIKTAIGSLFGTGGGLPSGTNRRDMNGFLSSISKNRGFSRPAHFYVEIVPPLMLRNEIDTTRSLAFLSESTSLPGVSLATTEIRRFGYGPVEKKPYAPIFVDTSFSFLVDGSGIVQKFFYKWMNGIVKFDGMPLSGYTQAGQNLIGPFEVNYKEQYKTDIIITTVDENNNDIINVRLFDAYPIFMGDISLSWSDTDSIARLPMTFTYFNWKIENINVGQVQPTKAPDTIQKLIKVGTAIQTLANIRKPNSVADVVNVVNNAKIAVGGII